MKKLLSLFLFSSNYIFSQQTNIGGIINSYTPVLEFNPCGNKIMVENATAFNAGDTILLIQMKGAIIDSTNTSSFGTITNYKNSGNYEFNYVKSKAGNVIELKNTIVRQYDIPTGKVQLIRVPYYQNANITSTLTCLPWDGSKGGVLVLNVLDTVELNADINTTGKGFLKGIMRNSNANSFTCGITDFYFPDNTINAAGKGEGIAFLSSNRNSGKGPSANGGGGGMNANSGGGGGSNGAIGGRGGYEWNNGCPNYLTSLNWGYPGNSLIYNNANNKIFMGGGGGAGHCNNQYDDPTANADFNGGNGGGLIIINTNYIKNNNQKIISKGDNAYELNVTNSYITHDGMGGGGAGGTVLLNNNNYINNLFIDVSGGKGGNLVAPIVAPGFVGPGGGGSGGVIWVKQNSLPANVAITNTGGNGGVIVQAGNIPYGASPGQSGINVFNLSVPVTTIPFKPNIDSVRLKDSAISCDNYNFKGLGYTNTSPVANWSWDFGDGNTANTQNTNHSYLTTGTFTVKLIITDINGCKDSISKDVNSSLLTMDAGPNDTICNASSTILQATNTGGTIFSWTPAAYVNNPALLNPTATPPSTTKFYLTATNAQGCSKTDSVIINVRSANTFAVNPPLSVCKNDSIQLSASGGDLYVWQPAATLNNAAIANPFATPQVNTPYTVQITDTICNNTTTLSTTVSVIALPVINATKSNDIDCSSNQSQLTATGAVQYIWSPAATLNNANASNPIATPLTTTKYVVSGTAISGCINYDSVTVNVNITGSSNYLMPTAFTPNNDGKNDCYGVKFWGIVQEIDFSIYNRWGERIFHSTKVGDCWNGTYKGVPQNTAVFVYVIRAKTTCQNDIFRKGTFALIR